MEEKDSYLNKFIFIAIGITLLGVIFPFLINYFFSDWQKSGTFGDTYGALNAVCSGITVAGLIITILMQRMELKNQRIEMVNTRKEFSINRITNIIYNQLERYEAAVENFNIKDAANGEFKGHAAIFHLNSKKLSVIRIVGDKVNEAELLKEQRDKNCQAIKLYAANHIAIAQFTLSAYNSVQVVREILYSSSLDIAEMNTLKNLFFRNIGFIHMYVLEDIHDKYMEYHELCKDETYFDKCGIDTGKLGQANIFLKSIIKFRNTVITDAGLAAIRENWIREFGASA